MAFTYILRCVDDTLYVGRNDRKTLDWLSHQSPTAMAAFTWTAHDRFVDESLRELHA